MDKTGLQLDHRPDNVIAPPKSKPQALTSPRSTTVTMYGCANAIGNSIPPYFIFKGIRFSPELLKWVSKGTKATMSESGWSNAKIFKQYLQEHFLPFARPDVADSQGRDYSQTILLIYDGHTSHVKPAVIE